VNHPPSEQTLRSCRRCELWKHATQAVGGEGFAAGQQNRRGYTVVRESDYWIYERRRRA
jgi:hypothetical protein